MGEEFSADLITLIDDEGVEREFEILDYIENEQISNFLKDLMVTVAVLTSYLK